MKDIELFWNEDHTKYAVLVSAGFGAGFASWDSIELAYDKRIVVFWLEHKDNKEWMRTVNQTAFGSSIPQSEANKEAVAFFHSIGYDECPYLGGFASIHLEWVEAGQKWIIEEYDGSESLCFEEDFNWICFE